MPFLRDEADERAARIDHILAEIRAHEARVRTHIQQAKRIVGRHEQGMKRIDRRLQPRDRPPDD